MEEEMMKHFNTYFFNEKGERIGSLFGIIPISVGMAVEIKGDEYEVGYTKLVLADNSKNDPELGLHVNCKTISLRR
ncbi:MAG: hypothetical protein ACRDE5_09740 [Ginsengibacter sp.]